MNIDYATLSTTEVVEKKRGETGSVDEQLSTTDVAYKKYDLRESDGLQLISPSRICFYTTNKL